MELAVNIPEHEPQVGQADRSTFLISSSEIDSSAARTIASTKSNVVSLPLTKLLPASIGPPDTKIVGTFRRIVAINIPGVILSQFERQTKASAQCALTMYSTASAMSSLEGRLYNMPECPIAIPSSTAMVLNSFATPPDFSISRATICPRSLR